MTLWSEIQGLLDSIVLKPFLSESLRTPWIVFRPVISEGSISLLITITAAISLANFFYIYKYMARLKAISSNVVLQLVQMDIAYLITSGNILAGLKRVLDGMLILPMHALLSFTGKLWLPIGVWGLVSLISGLCQTSVHSVTVSDVQVLATSINESNLLTVLQEHNLYQYQGRGLYNPQVAQAIIQGKNFQTSGFFYKNSSLCSGQFNSTLSYDTLCIRDDTECNNIDYTVGLRVGVVGGPKLIANLHSSYEMPRVYKVDNISILDAGVVLWSLDTEAKKAGYFVGLSGASTGSRAFTPHTLTSSFTELDGYLSMNIGNFTFSTWAGTCKHIISICDSFVDQGRIQIKQCKPLELPFLDMTIPLPLQNHFTFRSALSTVTLNSLPTDKTMNGTLMMSKTLGLLSFAWTLSSFNAFDTSRIPLSSRTVMNITKSINPGFNINLVGDFVLYSLLLYGIDCLYLVTETRI